MGKSKLILFLLFIFLLNNTNAYSQINDSIDTYTSDSMMIDILQKEGIPITSNNKVKLLKSGKEKFNDLFDEVRKAKHSIELEYFNFRNDSIAKTLFELLAQKAREGVKVRALFDAFGNMSNNKPLKKSHLKAIRESGVEIIKYDPIRFPWINHVLKRDHRKIIIIDGKIGYTGGMNIADYYITGLPKIGDWRDMHVKIEGEAVKHLQDIFISMWEKITKEKIDSDFNKYKDSIDAPVINGCNVAILDRWPGKTPKIMREFYVNSINSAKERIQIINPYFVPTSSIQKALEKALKRGVNVQIMIPGKSDIYFTPDAAFYNVNKLRKKGAEIYIFNGGFHHAKIMMIDSLYCTVGSTNLNSRSLRYDYEVNAVIFNKKVTSELINTFNNDKIQSTLLTKEIYDKRTPWKKFVGWFANVLTPFL